MQFSLQAASPDTSGYTLVLMSYAIQVYDDNIPLSIYALFPMKWVPRFKNVQGLKLGAYFELCRGTRIERWKNYF
jgi:hypothetical protein